MKAGVFVQFFALVALLASTWWIAQLNAESRAVENLVGLVETDSKGLNQIKEMSTILGEFSECKKEWIEQNFRNIENPKTVGTNALTFSVFGLGACWWASELSTLYFQQLGYEARLLQIHDKQARAVHIVLDVSLPNGERGSFDPLLDQLHLDAKNGEPLATSTLVEQWQTMCPNGTQTGFCKYSFEHGIRYTNWTKLGPVTPIGKSFFEVLGIESLRTVWLLSRRFLSKVVWVMSLALLLFTFICLKLR